MSAQQQQELKKLQQWMEIKRYSQQTIDCYLHTLRLFFNYHAEKSMANITLSDIDDFINLYIIKRKLSASYQSQFVNAIKLYYRINRNEKIEIGKIVRPKKAFQLPKVISMEDVSILLGGIKNIKHKTMLSVIYSAGLRRGELLNLNISDIDSNRMVINIRNGKGMKDRIVPLSELVLEMLRNYYKQYRPKEYLFEGQHGGKYSERSIELVLKKAVREAGIQKNINLHMLRHSYATHLMEMGTNLRYIQELLGHKSSRTTEIYTHVSRHAIQNITSPIDKLKLKL